MKLISNLFYFLIIFSVNLEEPAEITSEKEG